MRVGRAEMLKSGHRNIRRILKRLACCVGIAGALSAAVVVQAQASASCDAVNAGAFELTNTALGASSSAILTSWAVGDVLTVNITSADGLSRIDGLYHGPTFAVGSFGPLATGTVPSSGTLVFQHVVTSADLTNGIAIDPENNDSVVVGCGPAPTITANGVSPNSGSTSWRHQCDHHRLGLHRRDHRGDFRRDSGELYGEQHVSDHRDDARAYGRHRGRRGDNRRGNCDRKCGIYLCCTPYRDGDCSE